MYCLIKCIAEFPLYIIKTKVVFWYGFITRCVRRWCRHGVEITDRNLILVLIGIGLTFRGDYNSKLLILLANILI